MAIHYRRRGEVWHARGTVRVGRETFPVPEFSTGCRARADAEAVGAAEAARLRAEALDGPSGRARRLTVAECILTRLDRPRGVSRLDGAKIAAINEAMGHRTLADLPDAWAAWQRAHPAHSPGTARRYRAMILSLARAGCAARGMPPPPALPPVAADRGERVAMLTPAERERLLRAYSPHAGAVALVLAEQGCRTQEALRLDWRDVECAAETLRFGVRAGGHRTKTRRGRAVPMTARVALQMRGMWEAAGRPASGPVFLSSRGAPFADTTDRGGNPLRAAHATACRAAGVAGFRVHDWRHDWAARCVMSGMDLYTLMRLGGWSGLGMVERYAAVSAEHARDAVRRVA